MTVLYGAMNILESGQVRAEGQVWLRARGHAGRQAARRSWPLTDEEKAAFRRRWSRS